MLFTVRFTVCLLGGVWVQIPTPLPGMRSQRNAGQKPPNKSLKLSNSKLFTSNFQTIHYVQVRQMVISRLLAAHALLRIK